MDQEENQLGTAELLEPKQLFEAGSQPGLASLVGGWEDSEELAELWDRSQRISRRRPVDLDG